MRYMRRSILRFAVVTLANIALGTLVSGSEFSVRHTDEGVGVYIDGKLFTHYLTRSGKKPILWPIIGPTGKAMTRAFPMDETGSVTKDHLHHRSFWFAHGNVNGANLWSEEENTGSTRHKKFLEAVGGRTARIVTANDWLDPQGKKLGEDRRCLTFSVANECRLIDFDISIKASEQDLEIADTKEGTFAIRVPDNFRPRIGKGGRIINSEGDENKATWGKRASWVDYQGEIEGEKLGISILNHPLSYGYPTYWHVREYGLFAANPFGGRDFTGTEAASSSVTIAAGSEISLRYRVILHRGNEVEARIDDLFKEYANLK